ncbi:CocE/NonD family hydrolase [Streptomyces sp. NPDC101181]|uniref:CocE/NonD family hydrolase n=1 Tax=Streptomyces sp. NPDC101181 TaxID=3366125 RepID=UPI003814CC48
MRKLSSSTRTALAAVLALTVTGTLVTVAVATSKDDLTSTGGSRTAAVATDQRSVTHDENKRVPKGSRWTQHYFPSADKSKTELHADVLLPEKLPKGKKLPVILMVSSYFGHAGELKDERQPHTGPSDRFADLFEGADLFRQGYAVVMVDSRGFGGSSGCFDYGGLGELADVSAAIDWSAGQPWSTGAVGMYGKSFDAWTGLLGNNAKKKALKAVVAQEPIWDLYQHSHSNGVTRSNGIIAPSTYNEIANITPLPDDDKRYRKNATYELKHPECAATPVLAGTVDPGDPFWTQRDAVAGAKGTDTPLLFTQGLTENNTKPLGMEEYLANHRGVERGWIGPWDHVRGNERGADGKLAMGREGWLKETMAFFDEHLKGQKPAKPLPNYVIQDNSGKWREEKAWPSTVTTPTLALKGGRYTDIGSGSDPKRDAERAARLGAPSFLVRSEPVARDVRVSGAPSLTMTASGTGNVMVRLYDVAADGTGVAFNEQVARVEGKRLKLDLKSSDWTLKKGHQLAVQFGTVNAPNWIDSPSEQKISVKDAKLSLPLADPSKDRGTQGDPAPFLAQYVKINTAELKKTPATFSLPAVGSGG